MEKSTTRWYFGLVEHVGIAARRVVGAIGSELGFVGSMVH